MQTFSPSVVSLQSYLELLLKCSPLTQFHKSLCLCHWSCFILVWIDGLNGKSLCCVALIASRLAMTTEVVQKVGYNYACFWNLLKVSLLKKMYSIQGSRRAAFLKCLELFPISKEKSYYFYLLRQSQRLPFCLR